MWIRPSIFDRVLFITAHERSVQGTEWVIFEMCFAWTIDYCFSTGVILRLILMSNRTPCNSLNLFGILIYWAIHEVITISRSQSVSVSTTVGSWSIFKSIQHRKRHTFINNSMCPIGIFSLSRLFIVFQNWGWHRVMLGWSCYRRWNYWVSGWTWRLGFPYEGVHVWLILRSNHIEIVSLVIAFDTFTILTILYTKHLLTFHFSNSLNLSSLLSKCPPLSKYTLGLKQPIDLINLIIDTLCSQSWNSIHF